MFPATENTRSDGADVAGIAKYLRAAGDSALKLSSLSFHHCSGSLSYDCCDRDTIMAIWRLTALGVKTLASVAGSSSSSDLWSSYR